MDLIKKPTLPTGAVNFTKGDRVSMTKTPVIKVIVRWASGTDYDALAEVVYREDGQIKKATVSTFGTKRHENEFSTSVCNGAVKHLGDVGQGSDRYSDDKEEIIEIRMTPDIIAVVPYCYSAQSNNTGSFHDYQVSMIIDNGAGDVIAISSEEANDDPRVYTCVPAIIRQQGGEVVIDGVELYSKRNSEDRPTVSDDGVVKMDSGPRNAYK